MSGYRDDLDAAHARIAQLEEKVREKDSAKGHDAVAAARKRAADRARAEQELAAKSANARERTQMRDDLARGKLAPSRIGTQAWQFMWVLAAITGFFAVAIGIAGAMHPQVYSWGHWHENPAIEAAEIFGDVTGGFVAVALVVALIARRAYQRELAWVQTLPFAVIGHVRFLGRGDGTCHLELVGELPERSVAQDLARGVRDARTIVTLEDTKELALRIHVKDAFMLYDHWRAWRSLVSDVLMPLHEMAGLVSVRFEVTSR